MLRRLSTLITAALAVAGTAHAQRADENAVRAADDAFGVAVGNDKIGLYNERDTRGFSPVSASNVRLEGLYFDMRGNLPTRLLSASQIKVGITAQGYPFPAPTGIVDYQLKQVGKKRVISALGQVGPFDGYSVELDGYFPVQSDKLSVYAGGLVQRQAPAPGQTVQAYSVGTVARWRPTASLRAMAFLGHYDRLDGYLTPSVFTSGAFLPPRVTAERFSQVFTKSDLTGDSYGATGRYDISKNWTLDAGVFRYFQITSGNISETYLNTNEAGFAGARRFSRDPENKSDSYSGEGRLTGVLQGKHLRQTVHFSVRAREAMRTFGGSSVVNIGGAQIGDEDPIAPPNFTLGRLSRDEITQSSAGLSYSVALRGIGEFTAGAQKVNYKKTVKPPVGAHVITDDAPLLHNLALAITPTDKLVIYSSFTRGLEDANTAPDIAVNNAEAPPAIRTMQWDAGFRYALNPHMKLIAGYFHIQKPYFNLDPSNVYRQLGIEKHKGVEVSLAGTMLDGNLNLIAGAVLMNPIVTGEAVNLHLIGDKPVGQAETILKLNADYRIPQVKGLSVDAAINYGGERAATSRTFAALGNSQLTTNGLATLDLGMRYRFKTLGGKPTTFRVQAFNVTDQFAWQVQGSGALFTSNPRAIQASLAVDF